MHIDIFSKIRTGSETVKSAVSVLKTDIAFTTFLRNYFICFRITLKQKIKFIMEAAFQIYRNNKVCFSNMFLVYYVY